MRKVYRTGQQVFFVDRKAKQIKPVKILAWQEHSPFERLYFIQDEEKNSERVLDRFLTDSLQTAQEKQIIAEVIEEYVEG